MKILVADDDPVSREILCKIVSAAGEHQVTATEDGATAWSFLDDPARSFDVAFLDLSMPHMGGFDLLGRIRQSPLLHSLEVVFVTGSNDRPTIAKAIQAGARHYVIKPCTAPVVVAKLNQIREAVERRWAGASWAKPPLPE